MHRYGVHNLARFFGVGIFSQDTSATKMTFFIGV